MFVEVGEIDRVYEGVVGIVLVWVYYFWVWEEFLVCVLVFSKFDLVILMFFVEVD